MKRYTEPLRVKNIIHSALRKKIKKTLVYVIFPIIFVILCPAKISENKFPFGKRLKFASCIWPTFTKIFTI